MKIKAFIFFICLAHYPYQGSAQSVGMENDPYPLFFLQKNLTQLLINDNISPPVASRNYVYPHIAAYCILAMSEKGIPITNAIEHFPSITWDVPGNNYSPSFAASVAFYQVAAAMIYTQQPFTDSFSVLLNWYKARGIDSVTFRVSSKIGNQVAKTISEWMNKDRFNETRNMSKYILLKEPGKWQLTSPSYLPAVEPYWGKLRPLLCNGLKEIDQLKPIAFDSLERSDFYQEALNIYNIKRGLTEEQKEIASFWDCNPFAIKPIGHINLIEKKISPGGHWMNITGIACKNTKSDILETSKAFTLCAISLFDAFIITWDKKYLYNYLRPETFIEQMGIDNNWQPFIQSPPFPEFPSGHAVVSNSAATVLTFIFGNNFSYVDDSESEFGLKERKFNSFHEAAEEATISRVYGGIHFQFSCEMGKKMGRIIGTQIVLKIKTNK